MEPGTEKRSHEDEETETRVIKKQKVFSAKEFRHKLNTAETTAALTQFLHLCNSKQSEEYIIQYLNTGGNLLELLQLLNNKSVDHTLVLDAAKFVLLHISISEQNSKNSPFEACKYLLNTHSTTINKMIGSTSTSRERVVILKLLTTMVTLSSALAKDILLYVQLNQAAIDILIKSGGVKADNPRNAFVQFLTSFLLDGNYPLISLLLSKKNLLSSVIHGLKFDQADTVCMVIQSLRQFILENPAVSKSMKMKTFSTPVVKDLVNLYNWKGPSVKIKKSKEKEPVIDLVEKSKVSDCVHGFLLVLCTSHRHGVIFRDDQVGLQDRRHQNALMYTVLESLDRPWEHSYAAELVMSIAKACPDLVRTVWSNMREFLEPRSTKKWLNTMKYATELSKNMSPKVFKHCATELSINQYSQLINILASPAQVLNTLIPKRFEFESVNVKVNVIAFLNNTLRSIAEFVNYSKIIHATNDYVKVKLFAMEYVKSHYPSIQDLLRNWEIIPETPEHEKNELGSPCTALEVLVHIIDLLTLYSQICPEALNDLSVHCNLNELFAIIPEDVESQATSNDSSFALKATIVKLFHDNDPKLFLPETDLFATTLSFLFQAQYQDACANEMLRKLFLSTTIFDGCEFEIDIWIHSIHAIKSFSASVGDFYLAALGLTIQNGKKYYKTLSKYSPQSMKVAKGNYSDILEQLQKDSSETHHSRNNFKHIRHNQLSLFTLGCLNVLKDSDKVSKRVKECFNFALINLLHAQTQADSLISLIKDYEGCDFINEHVFHYIQSWANSDSNHILDCSVKYFNLLTSGLISANISSFLKKYGDGINEVKFVPSFFVSNLANLKQLTPNISEQCALLFDHLPSENMSEVFRNPNLLASFKPQSSDDCTTQFIVKIAEKYTSIGDLDKDVLAPFTEKVHQSIINNLKADAKESTLKNLSNLLSTFRLNKFTCKSILKRVALLDVNKFINVSNNLSSIYDLTVYCLSSFDEDGFKESPLDGDTFSEISTALQVLNRKPESFNTSNLAQAIYKYLKEFPHNIANLDDSLLESILLKAEYCNENTELAVFILKLNRSFQETVVEHIDAVSNKKGVMLRIIDTMLKQNPNQEILDILFTKFEISIAKALTKPQKAGLHFKSYYNSVGILIEKCSSEDFAKHYCEKVIKYEYSEGFLAPLLKSVFMKHLIRDPEGKEGLINNSLLTLTSVLLTFLKNKETKSDDLNVISQTFFEYIQHVKELKISFTQTSENESFRLFCKFALKVGISGQYLLLKVLKEFLSFIELADEDAELFFDMTILHSEFFNVATKTDCALKRELFGLLLEINDRWTCTRKGDHIPIFLSSFAATNSESDVTILRILKLYELLPAQTNFYDYRPFIIGDAACNFYSIRPGVQKSLWRQPNMADTLQFLDEPTVMSTIKHFPNNTDFHSHTFADNLSEGIRKCTYNLQFLLPLFTSMLAPENNVPTYMFSRSGALSLTILALSSESKEMRHAACFVLSRYYHHLESKHRGKDNLLWLRFVQSLCRGLATLDPIKLSNLVAVALAQMALILTQPTHVMYTPLANYLTAKDALDVTAIPELYTFMNSSSLDAKEHRSYILGLIQDGVKTKDDVKLTAKSMLFKLIMDMYHSTSNDLKIDVLKLILAVVKIPLGAKILCESNGLIPWLYGLLEDISGENKIQLMIVKILEYITTFSSSLLIFNRIIDSKLCKTTPADYYEILIKCAIKYFEGDVREFDKTRVRKLLLNKRCQYMIEYDFDSHIIEDTSRELDQLSYTLTSIYLRRK